MPETTVNMRVPCPHLRGHAGNRGQHAHACVAANKRTPVMPIIRIITPVPRHRPAAVVCSGQTACGRGRVRQAAGVSCRFYAMKDTRTPVYVSFWTLLVNVFVGLLLMQSMGHAGLALALTIASVFNAVVLTILLARRLGELNLVSISGVVIRMVPGLSLMAIVVTLILGQADWLTQGAFASRFVLLSSAVICGGLVYVASLYLFGVKEIQQVRTMVLSKLSKSSHRS